MTQSNSYDAVIIGGGPAGATAAAVLAQQGRRVVVLEKGTFPRYHIGESLLPFCYFPLERIGMLEKLAAAPFVQKHSVQFIGASGRQSQPFYFSKHMDHPAAQTWQVLRSEFDLMLLDNAREKGAEVIEGVTAKSFLREDGAVRGVAAAGRDGAALGFAAPVTVDASGRNAFAINQHKWRLRDPRLNKMSVWTYYRGARRDPGLDEGATTVAYGPEGGWFWYIPLHDDLVSVGVVADRDCLFGESKDPKKIFQRVIECNPWIVEHLAVGTQTGEYFVTGDFSYRSRYCAADGLVLTGDAFCFLDPVFSSGVYLALRSGELAADAVDAALTAGDAAGARFQEYGDRVCQELEAMRKLVYAFYDPQFNFGQFLKKYPQLRGDLTDCLIGRLTHDFGPLFNAMGEFAELPAPLGHGGALTSAGAQAILD